MSAAGIEYQTQAIATDLQDAYPVPEVDLKVSTREATTTTPRCIMVELVPLLMDDGHRCRLKRVACTENGGDAAAQLLLPTKSCIFKHG